MKWSSSILSFCPGIFLGGMRVLTNLSPDSRNLPPAIHHHQQHQHHCHRQHHRHRRRFCCRAWCCVARGMMLPVWNSRIRNISSEFKKAKYRRYCTSGMYWTETRDTQMAPPCDWWHIHRPEKKRAGRKWQPILARQNEILYCNGMNLPVNVHGTGVS